MGNTWAAMNRQFTDGNNSELNYLEITEEILDGIFPEEEIKKVKLLENEKKLCADFIIDIYGKPQLVSDFKTANKSEWKQEEYRRLDHCFAIISPYATIHISVLFIIILSFLSCIFANIISVLTTIIIISSIVTLDYKYKLGLAAWDSELIS